MIHVDHTRSATALRPQRLGKRMLSSVCVNRHNVSMALKTHSGGCLWAQAGPVVTRAGNLRGLLRVTDVGVILRGFGESLGGQQLQPRIVGKRIRKTAVLLY